MPEEDSNISVIYLIYRYFFRTFIADTNNNTNKSGVLDYPAQLLGTQRCANRAVHREEHSSHAGGCARVVQHLYAAAGLVGVGPRDFA